MILKNSGSPVDCADEYQRISGNKGFEHGYLDCCQGCTENFRPPIPE